MLEICVLGIFAAMLLACVILNYSVIYAMILGYALFFGYSISKKFTIRDIARMSFSGVKKVKNVLIAFVLIGMITAVWRDCGTIPFIIYHSSKIISPSLFVLITFLICCFISLLTGTSFGTAATVGVICMTLGELIGANPLFIGGAILSGAYFGDRCSPMSTSALLVSELTKTELYINIKNMVKTSVFPFITSCIIYFVLGIFQNNSNATIETWSLFYNNFNLNPLVILPALIVIALCMFKVKVRGAMLISILTGCIISIFLQHTPFEKLMYYLVFGFAASDKELASMLNGGGITSMLRVMAIVCLSSCYTGIFDETGMLNGIKTHINLLSKKISAYSIILISSILTSIVACNQTLSIMLTHYLCKDIETNNERLAVNLENTVVVISPLIPWSIACAVPLMAAGAPIQSVLAAFYLHLLPLWGLISQGKSARKNNEYIV